MAHGFDVAAFVGRCGEAVVDPEEGAYLHLLVGLAQLFHSLCGEANDLAGSHEVLHLIAEVGEGSGLAADGPCSFFASPDDDGCSAEFVASGDDAVFGEDEHGARAFDLIKYVLYAINKALAAGDEQSDEFGGVRLAAGHFAEVVALIEEFAGEFFQVVDFRHGDDGHFPQMGVDDDGLGVGIRDDADASLARELLQFLLEACAEVLIFEVVDAAVESFLRRESGQTTALGAKVGIVVGAVEEVCDAPLSGDCSEEAAHGVLY